MRNPATGLALLLLIGGAQNAPSIAEERPPYVARTPPIPNTSGVSASRNCEGYDQGCGSTDAMIGVVGSDKAITSPSARIGENKPRLTKSKGADYLAQPGKNPLLIKGMWELLRGKTSVELIEQWGRGLSTSCPNDKSRWRNYGCRDIAL